MEDICVDVTSKKNRALDEKERAINESVQFREDVDYLTKETTNLLDELQREQQAKKSSESKLQDIHSEHETFQKTKIYEIEEKKRQIQLAYYDRDKLKEEV